MPVIGKGEYMLSISVHTSSGLRLLWFDKGASKSSSGLSVGMLQIYLWIHQKIMLFSVVCQPESLEEGSGAGSTAMQREASSWLCLGVTVLVKQWY